MTVLPLWLDREHGMEPVLRPLPALHNARPAQAGSALAMMIQINATFPAMKGY
jgi:hypothetical protein